MDDIDSAARTSDALRDYWDVLDSLSMAKYHVLSIRTAIRRDDMEALEGAVEKCMTDFASHRVYPQLSFALSEASLRLGDAGEALKHLREYSESCGQQAPSAEYLELLSRVLEAEGDFKGAYEAILDHNKASGSSTIGILGSDTIFIEARHDAALREIKVREKTHRVLTTSLIILIIFILLTRYMMDAMDIVKKELSSSEEKIKNLENEHGALKSILQRPTLIDEESRTLINDRFELLDKVLLSHLSSEAKEKAGLEDGIDKLLGKKNEFISSLSKALSMTCPSFFKYLSDASLNDFEIGYCYLYILGMQKKDVESFLSKRCIDTVTKDIRRKLDLERNDVKLKTFLGEKFQELENK